MGSYSSWRENQAKLIKDEDGRWCIGSFDLHCGDSVEIWDGEMWRRFRIEAMDGEYYAVGLKQPLREGMLARLPENRKFTS